MRLLRERDLVLDKERRGAVRVVEPVQVSDMEAVVLEGGPGDPDVGARGTREADLEQGALPLIVLADVISIPVAPRARPRGVDVEHPLAKEPARDEAAIVAMRLQRVPEGLARGR